MEGIKDLEQFWGLFSLMGRLRDEYGMHGDEDENGKFYIVIRHPRTGRAQRIYDVDEFASWIAMEYRAHQDEEDEGDEPFADEPFEDVPIEYVSEQIQAIHQEIPSTPRLRRILPVSNSDEF